MYVQSKKYPHQDISLLEALDGVSKVVKSSTANLRASYSTLTASYTFLSIASTYDGFSVELVAGELPTQGNNSEVLISSSTAKKMLYLADDMEGLIGKHCYRNKKKIKLLKWNTRIRLV